MSLEIKGGASEYEAAAILAVLARVDEENAASRASLPPRRRPPAWVRAYLDSDPEDPLAVVTPDRRGPVPRH